MKPEPGVDGREWLAGLIDNVRLTPRAHDVARILATNPRAGAFAPASQLAKEAGVNVATVVRFAQALGFSGWKEFQLHFRHRYLGSLLPSDLARDRYEEAEGSPFEAALHHDLQNIQGALSTVDRATLAEVVKAIGQARKTLVVSSGSYAAVAHVLVHGANVMGYDARLETRGGPHVIAALSSLGTKDCLVAVSFWRLVRHVVVTAEECNRRGVPTVAITDSIFSPLARAADHTLMVPTESVSWFQSMSAALSVVYGLLAELHEFGGARADEAIRDAEALYEDFDVLYDWGQR
jgi:DNA-binding MurR/RpiR family transcriptional regulator